MNLRRLFINLTEDELGKTHPLMDKFLDALKPYLKVDLAKCYYHSGNIILQDDKYFQKVLDFLRKIRFENKDSYTYRFDGFKVKSIKTGNGYF